MVELLEHGVARVQLLKLMLRVVRQRHVHAVVDGAGVGFHDACDHLHKRGFARAVGAHKRHLVAAVHGEVEVVVDALVAEGLHQPRQRTTSSPVRGGCTKLKWMASSPRESR